MAKTVPKVEVHHFVCDQSDHHPILIKLSEMGYLAEWSGLSDSWLLGWNIPNSNIF